MISTASSDEELDELNEYIYDTLAIFSSTFLLMCFTIYYFFNLVKDGVPKFTNNFFPDKAFGDSNPMHQMSTKATSKALKGVPGLKYASDVAKHQLGKVASKPGKAVGSAIGKATTAVARNVGNTAKAAVNSVRGKK